MKNSILRIFTALTLALIMFDCTPKYGAHFTKRATETGPKENIVEIQKSENAIATWISKEVVTKEEVIESEVKENSIASVDPIPLVKQHVEIVEMVRTEDLIAHRSAERAGFRKEVRVAKRQQRKEFRSVLKERINEAKALDGDDDYVLMMLLAILIPPLGVGLTYGIEQEFWISLLLTLLFVLPGMIYSLIMVHKFFRG